MCLALLAVTGKARKTIPKECWKCCCGISGKITPNGHPRSGDARRRDAPGLAVEAGRAPDVSVLRLACLSAMVRLNPCCGRSKTFAPLRQNCGNSFLRLTPSSGTPTTRSPTTMPTRKSKSKPSNPTNHKAGRGCPGASCSPCEIAFARFHESRRQKLIDYIEKRVARHVKSGGNDSPSYRNDCAYDGIRDLPGNSDREIWNAAWNVCLENS